jgi:hypothetical protein
LPLDQNFHPILMRIRLVFFCVRITEYILKRNNMNFVTRPTAYQSFSKLLTVAMLVAIGALLSFAPAFAQEQSSTFGQLRGAISENPADTGFEFTEAGHVKAATDFWRARATSGENKDWADVLRVGYKSMTALGNSIAMKGNASTTSFSSSWLPIGGAMDGLVSGRTRGVAFDPSNPSVLYVAAAQGGVWKTTNVADANITWVNLTESLPTNVFGAIAVDPKNPQVLYAGTGEVAGGFSTPGGAGLYKSIDGGNNWYVIALTSKIGSTIGTIVIDPTNSNKIFVGTGSGFGLQISLDSGHTFTKAPTVSDAVSVVVDPNDPNKVYAGCQNGGVYRSVDGGVSFTKCTISGGTGSQNTTMLAMAPSATNVIYASINNGGATYGIAKTSDFGVTWNVTNKCNTAWDPNTSPSPSDALKTPNASYLWNQGYYGNAIVVNPNNAAQILVGGVDIWSSSDSGKSLKHSGFWREQEGGSFYSHADVHKLLYNKNVLYACTDGGLSVSNNDGGAWSTALNKGLATFQFVGIDADKKFTYVLGGTQDNGVLRALKGENQFHYARGGDAGILWISSENGGTCYSTYVNADFQKSGDSGKSWMISNLTGKTNFIANTQLLGEQAPFYASWDVFPDGTYVAYAGNSHIFISSNGGEDGFVGGTSVTKSIGATCVHISQSDPNNMWAGAGGGKVWRSADLGVNWKSYLVGSGAGQVTGVFADPNNPGSVWACTVGGSHFYMSSDSGKSWTTPATNFPNVPCNAVTRDAKGNLYVGTDYGVVASSDLGVTWQVYGLGIPKVQVLSLKIKGLKDEILLAGTYGRGSYYVSSLAAGVGSVPSVASTMQLDPSYPNPIDLATTRTATIGFSMMKSGTAKITLHDVVGHEIRTIANQMFSEGHHTVELNTEGLASGTYLYALTSNGATLTQKVVVTK